MCNNIHILNETDSINLNIKKEVSKMEWSLNPVKLASQLLTYVKNVDLNSLPNDKLMSLSDRLIDVKFELDQLGEHELRDKINEADRQVFITTFNDLKLPK